MREAEYITMLDPLQDKYGRIMGAVLYIPAFLGETFWSASILSALGATLTVILGLEMNLSVIVSACIAVGYTFFGGLYSVAYTDVVQLICIAIGLWLTVPFCLSHDHVVAISSTQSEWVGSLGGAKVGKWIDYAMLLVSLILYYLNVQYILMCKFLRGFIFRGQKNCVRRGFNFSFFSWNFFS